jgi:hypothetical protein
MGVARSTAQAQGAGNKGQNNPENNKRIPHLYGGPHHR